ncbi:MAG: hypothetical protein N3A54_01785 [Patescibacteria group bacterium]|nr:hypothetical protein [Patescibacteria group bacterium]
MVFHSLTEKEIGLIVDLQLRRVEERLRKHGIQAQFTEPLRQYLAEVGYDPAFGARPLKRVIQDQILDELALQMIEKAITPNSVVKIDYKDKKILFLQPN